MLMRKCHRSALFVFSILAVFLLNGCAVMDAAKARMEPRSQFVSISGKSTIYYDPGLTDSQVMAQRLARSWEGAVNSVEQAYGVAFVETPTIYICNAKCFAKYTTMHASVPAGQFMDSIFMNDPVLRQRELKFHMTPESFLVHEMVHLLLYQHAGGLNYMRVPAWFREGFAVVVSGGAGAEACTAREAAMYLLAGKAFDPAEAGSLFLNRTASSYGLRYPVFYRQAGMFVAFLMEMNRPAFQSALNEIVEGKDFQQSFRQAYGHPLSDYWPDFMERMQKLAPVNPDHAS